jgi:methionyl-tRNA synthetase
MVHRYLGGVRPTEWAPDSLQDPAARESLAQLIASAATAHAEVPRAYESLRLQDALNAAWVPVVRANEFIERVKPWVVAKDPARRQELATALNALLETLRLAAIWSWPAIPAKSEVLWSSMLRLAGQPGEPRGEAAAPAFGRTPLGDAALGDPLILFPRIELGADAASA